MLQGDNQPIRIRLRHERALLHEEGACLPLRSRHGQCRVCVEACPVDALAVSVASVQLSDACIDCGRCTAACPTQALALPEMLALAESVPDVEPARALRVECRKVPESHRSAGALVVPCTGALSPGHLLARHAAGLRVEVIDRGWCDGCEASGTGAEGHPAQASIDEAGLWLEAAGAGHRPTLVEDALPIALRPDRIPPAPEPAEPKLDRRAFFRDVIQRPAGRHRQTPTPMGGDGRAAYPSDRRQPSPERERRLAAVLALAQRHATAVPAELYPALSVDARCCDQRLCVALCPTAALTVADGTTSARLLFSAERCIACGTCVRGCPDGAMHLEPHGGQPGIHMLAEHERAACSSCGDVFSPTAGQRAQEDAPLCPICMKSRRFMDDARRLMHRN